MCSKALQAALCALGFTLAPVAFAAATITIVNNDLAGVGFNDATVVAPVGGNMGTTLGQQRLNAFQAAADKWGATLNSSVPIRIGARWTALTCTATSAVLGSAGAASVFRDFTSAPAAGHWYGKALANSLSRSELSAGIVDINANFNVNLGQAGCLTGSSFYLGLDNNHGTNIDLVTVLLHEFAHGLGFQTYTNGATGVQLVSFPSIWDKFLLDTGTGKSWTMMTDAERIASATNTGKLVWSGANVQAATTRVLQAGSPGLTIYAPSSIGGRYLVGTATFGPALASPGEYGEIAQVVDTPPSTGLACTPLSPANAAAVTGRIALIDRGTCTFKTKVLNAQTAGAIGVIIADNVAGSPPAGMGDDVTITTPITIPSVRVTLADGNTLKAALAAPSLVVVNVGVNMAIRVGADASNRPFMYAPSTYASGSSVSHWDTSAFPNQLMEPAINPDLLHAVKPPTDLTTSLLKDIGWSLVQDPTPVLMLLLD